MRSGLALLVGVTVYLGSVGAALSDEIFLPNRTFDPPPGIDTKLRDRLATTPQSERVQAVVQLPAMPSEQHRDDLQRAGVALGTYAGGNAFLARIRGGTNPDAIPGLRWAGLVLPMDKVSQRLWGMATAAGTTQLLVAVYFEDDVTPATARALVQQLFPVTQTYGSLNAYALRIQRAALEPLALEPSVRWVEEIDPDLFPLPIPP